MDESTYERAIRMLQERLKRMKVQLEHTNHQQIPYSEVKKESTQEEMLVPEIIPYTEESEREELEERTTGSLKVVSKASEDVFMTSIHVFSSKKESLKHSILQLLGTGQRTTIQLKKQFVDLDRKCSKASFYRYIQELKKEQKITILQIGEIDYCLRVEK